MTFRAVEERPAFLRRSSRLLSSLLGHKKKKNCYCYDRFPSFSSSSSSSSRKSNVIRDPPVKSRDATRSSSLSSRAKKGDWRSASARPCIHLSTQSSSSPGLVYAAWRGKRREGWWLVARAGEGRADRSKPRGRSDCEKGGLKKYICRVVFVLFFFFTKRKKNLAREPSRSRGTSRATPTRSAQARATRGHGNVCVHHRCVSAGGDDISTEGVNHCLCLRRERNKERAPVRSSRGGHGGSERPHCTQAKP